MTSACANMNMNSLFSVDWDGLVKRNATYFMPCKFAMTEQKHCGRGNKKFFYFAPCQLQIL